MTAFTTAQLPTNARACSTVEQLALWCAYILQRFSNRGTYNRVTGEPQEPLTRVTEFLDADGVARVQIVLTLPKNIDGVANTTPDWLDVNELATTPIPASFSG
jgi:hypothetical protein